MCLQLFLKPWNKITLGGCFWFPSLFICFDVRYSKPFQSELQFFLLYITLFLSSYLWTASN
jgi:hypothetical protein